MKSMRKKKITLSLSIVLSIIFLFVGFGNSFEVQAATKKIVYNDGDIYNGGVTSSNVKSGKGKYICADGTILTGTWKKDFLTGQGKAVYKGKDTYTGNFQQDKRSGTGTYRFKNGDRYVGKWKNDKMHGSGKYVFKNGNYVNGTWKQGKLNGTCFYKKGKYIYTMQVSNGKLKKVSSRKKA